MKKQYLVIVVFLAALLCVGTMAWAQEATVFDGVEKILIRGYLECTGGCTGQTPTYSAYLEIRDKDGLVITDVAKLCVKGHSIPDGTANSSCLEGFSSPTANPFKIHDNDVSV